MSEVSLGDILGEALAKAKLNRTIRESQPQVEKPKRTPDEIAEDLRKLTEGFEDCDCELCQVQYDDESDDEPWSDEDEAGLEEYEERRRERIAERNEY